MNCRDNGIHFLFRGFNPRLINQPFHQSPRLPARVPDIRNNNLFFIPDMINYLIVLMYAQITITPGPTIQQWLQRSHIRVLREQGHIMHISLIKLGGYPRPKSPFPLSKNLPKPDSCLMSHYHFHPRNQGNSRFNSSAKSCHSMPGIPFSSSASARSIRAFSSSMV